jgi:hypothetical protein
MDVRTSWPPGIVPLFNYIMSTFLTFAGNCVQFQVIIHNYQLFTFTVTYRRLHIACSRLCTSVELGLPLWGRDKHRGNVSTCERGSDGRLAEEHASRFVIFTEYCQSKCWVGHTERMEISHFYCTAWFRITLLILLPQTEFKVVIKIQQIRTLRLKWSLLSKTRRW